MSAEPTAQAGPNPAAQAASSDPCAQRIMFDINTLRALSEGQWRDRVRIAGFNFDPRGALLVRVELQAQGLRWSAGGPAAWDRWDLVLVVPPRYPLQMPGVVFIREVPFCPHVVHRDCPPPGRLPPGLQDYLVRGHGHCCYMQSTDWSWDVAACNLAVVLWQVSRIVTLEKVHGEANGLNHVARDHATRLAAEGRTPLGPALPLPEIAAGAEKKAAAIKDADSDVVYWDEATSGEPPARDREEAP
jgi:hypothetical protein